MGFLIEKGMLINMDNSQKYARSEWFRNDRFGMFIHWGLYAIPARGEWVRNRECIKKPFARPIRMPAAT